MAKETLTGSGLKPETSGLTYQHSSHLSYPALWMVAVPNSQLVFAGVYIPSDHFLVSMQTQITVLEKLTGTHLSHQFSIMGYVI